MRLPRFFISPEQATGSRVIITGEDVRHISLVLRMKAGDELLLCDGRGTEYRVTIVGIGRTEVLTEIMDRTLQELPEPRVTLYQGLPKSDKMDFIVQKATELGVSSIVPLITERTIVKVRDGAKRVGRWQKIAREAAMQSNRPDIPQVHDILPFSEFLRTPDAERETLRLMPWEEGTEPMKTVVQKHPHMKSISVLIGPEGGFSASEASAARQRGFQIVSLGRNILRTETASLAVLAVIGYVYGK